MDWSLGIAIMSLLVAAVVGTIGYAALDDDKRARFYAFWGRVVNGAMLFVAVGFSLFTVGAFWVSNEPITRSSIIVLGLHFFNLAIWTFLLVLWKGADQVRAERATIRERVSLLEAQVQALKSPPRDC